MTRAQPRLRIVSRETPPCPRRGRGCARFGSPPSPGVTLMEAYGGITRSIQLTDHGLGELIAIAERLEARRA
jgi:hypothetical protein